MAWITPTIDLLKNRLSEPELTKVGNAKLAEGQTLESVFAEVLRGVVRLIRGYAAVKNKLGPAGTIPDETEDAALAILRFRTFTRLPNLGLLGEDRRKEYDDAIRLLAALGHGDFLIEAPEEVSEEQIGNFGSEVVSCRPNTIGGGRLDGL